MVEDASTIQGQVQAQGASLESHQTYASETRQALLRSVAVFSQVLNIPVPIPLKSLSKEPRKGFHPSSSSSISSHPTPSHETTSKSSPPPHFPVNSQGPVPPSPYPSHPHPHPHSPHLSSAHATAAAAAGGGFLEERSPFDRLIPQRGISERSMMAYDDNNKVSGEDWIKELENEALKSSGLCKPY